MAERHCFYCNAEILDGGLCDLVQHQFFCSRRCRDQSAGLAACSAERQLTREDHENQLALELLRTKEELKVQKEWQEKTNQRLTQLETRFVRVLAVIDEILTWDSKQLWPAGLAMAQEKLRKAVKGEP